MTYPEIIEKWNAQADEYNQWDNLSEEEKIEFACQGHIKTTDLEKGRDYWKNYQADSFKLLQENKAQASTIAEQNEKLTEKDRSWNMEHARAEHAEAIIIEQKSEIARLKTALSGRTYYHDNTKVEAEIAALQASSKMAINALEEIAGADKPYADGSPRHISRSVIMMFATSALAEIKGAV
jgi:hypothetical protein